LKKNSSLSAHAERQDPFCFLFVNERKFHDMLHGKLRTAESYLYYLKKFSKNFRKNKRNPVNGFTQVQEKLKSLGIDLYRAGFAVENKDGRHLKGDEADIVLKNAIWLGQLRYVNIKKLDAFNGLFGLFTFTVGSYYEALCSGSDEEILKAQKVMYVAYKEHKAHTNRSLYIHLFGIHGRTERKRLIELGLTYKDIQLQGTENRNQRDGQRKDNNGGGRRKKPVLGEKQEDTHFDVMLSGVFEFPYKVPIESLSSNSKKPKRDDKSNPSYVSWFNSVKWEEEETFVDDFE